MDKFSILTQFDFFQKASPSFQKEMEARSQPAQLERGAFFYHAGDHCRQFALVGSGNIRVFKTCEEGRQITLYHLRDGETCLVNMLCAFLNQASPASAQAESTVDALLFPAATFQEWVRTVDVVRAHVFELMSSRVLEVMMLVEEVAFRRMDRRIATFLLDHSQGSDAQNKIITTTHERIAAELGTAREVVSRVLKDLENLGAIEIARGHLEVRNSKMIRELSQR